MPRVSMIKPRRATLAQWATAEASGAVLADGEPGYISDESAWVIGDGITKVASLPRLSPNFGTGPSSLTFLQLITQASCTVGNSNRRHYYRVREGGTISKSVVHIGASSGNIDITWYRNTGAGITAAPGTIIATTGNVSSPGVGVQEISLGGSYVINPGDWVSIAADNTTFACAGWMASGAPLTTSNLYKGITGYEDSAMTAPATPTVTWGLARGIVVKGVA